MNEYKIKKYTISISYKDRDEIAEGITLFDENPYIEDVETFSIEDVDFEEKISEFQTEIRELSSPVGKYFKISEYHLINEWYDEIKKEEMEEILLTSKLNISLVEKPTYKEIGNYNNFSDAEEAMENYYNSDTYDEDKSVYLSY